MSVKELRAEIEVLRAAIEEHRSAMRRIFGPDYGSPKSDGGKKSADAALWKLLEDE
jgi:hypothetical protein